MRWSSYVALGDSFTEGLWDVVDEQGNPDPEASARAADAPHAPETLSLQLRGWADLLASHLAARREVDAQGPLRYANLAIRGRLLGRIVEEQVPAALALKPDLVSLVGGGNDILRPAVDVDAIAAKLENAVVRLREAGADVLLATGMDSKDSPLVAVTRWRVGVLNAHIWSIARRHGAFVLDQWGTRSLQDWRMWASDRIHPNADAHERLAQAALAALGLAPDDEGWDDPLSPLPALARGERWREDARWFREHAYPWATRRLHKRSSADGRTAKFPELIEVPTR